MAAAEPVVYVVDDDRSVQGALRRTLRCFPEINIPYGDGFWVIFKAEWQRHSSAMS